MGMFDYVRSEVPLPDGFTGELQSKDFDCAMSMVVIRSGGRLEIERFEEEEVPQAERPYPNGEGWEAFIGCIRRINEHWEDLNFHGDFNFYGNGRAACGADEWHEYIARFTDGQLSSITVIAQGIEAAKADETGTGSAVDESDGGVAMRPDYPYISGTPL